MTKRSFRFFIIAKWLLSIFVVVLSITTESLLPPELRGYIEGVRNGPTTTQGWILFIIAVTFILFGIALSIGLFQFRKWAKNLLWPSFGVGIILLPFFGPSVQTEWTGTLSYISSLVDGMVLALVYYSPVSKMFDTTNAV